MRPRPRLLDLFCRAGGAGVGYSRAGFEVVGVDLLPQRDYPFEFHQDDALTFPLDGFDAYHASAPCQLWSDQNAGRLQMFEHPDLIGPTRERLLATGLPFILENVDRAPLRRDLLLCGFMFGLAVIRHRVFELHGFAASAPSHPDCRGAVSAGLAISVVGTGGGTQAHRGRRKRFDGLGVVESRQRAMGIDWMTDAKDLAEAIPPAYTAHIGRALLGAIEKAA